MADTPMSSWDVDAELLNDWRAQKEEIAGLRAILVAEITMRTKIEEVHAEETARVNALMERIITENETLTSANEELRRELYARIDQLRGIKAALQTAVAEAWAEAAALVETFDSTENAARQCRIQADAAALRRRECEPEKEVPQ